MRRAPVVTRRAQPERRTSYQKEASGFDIRRRRTLPRLTHNFISADSRSDPECHEIGRRINHIDEGKSCALNRTARRGVFRFDEHPKRQHIPAPGDADDETDGTSCVPVAPVFLVNRIATVANRMLDALVVCCANVNATDTKSVAAAVNGKTIFRHIRQELRAGRAHAGIVRSQHAQQAEFDDIVGQKRSRKWWQVIDVRQSHFISPSFAPPMRRSLVREIIPLPTPHAKDIARFES